MSKIGVLPLFQPPNDKNINRGGKNLQHDRSDSKIIVGKPQN